MHNSYPIMVSGASNLNKTIILIWADSKGPTVVQVSYSVRDHTMKTKRSMSKPLVFLVPASVDAEEVPKGIPVVTSLEDTSQIILQVVSPSKKKRASLRKSEISGGRKIVEIWNEGLLEISLDVSDLHGDFYGDGNLASFCKRTYDRSHSMNSRILGFIGICSE